MSFRRLLSSVKIAQHSLSRFSTLSGFLVDAAVLSVSNGSIDPVEEGGLFVSKVCAMWIFHSISCGRSEDIFIPHV